MPTALNHLPPSSSRPPAARRLVLGPASWLSLSYDVLAWRALPPGVAAARFARARQRGHLLWREAIRYRSLNERLLCMAIARLLSSHWAARMDRMGAVCGAIAAPAGRAPRDHSVCVRLSFSR